MTLLKKSTAKSINCYGCLFTFWQGDLGIAVTKNKVTICLLELLVKVSDLYIDAGFIFINKRLCRKKNENSVTFVTIFNMILPSVSLRYTKATLLMLSTRSFIESNPKRKAISELFCAIDLLALSSSNLVPSLRTLQ